VVSLSFGRRRKPLGQLPVARLGTRPGAIGIPEIAKQFSVSRQTVYSALQQPAVIMTLAG